MVKALNGVNLTVRRGEVLGLVGESGAGKTVTALSVLRLLPYPGKVVAGGVFYDGQDLLSLSEERMRQVRGRELAVVFQDAMAALTPTLTLGEQMEESLLVHSSTSRKQARAVAEELCREIGLPDPHNILGLYPFQISGGMAQRVALAMALALRPRLLIADEPTSNVDVTLQADILDRLRRLQHQQDASILLITHNMGVVAQVAQRVAVMYAGAIVEQGDTVSIFRRPSHPYTWGLFQALPRLDNPDVALRPMPGVPPDLMNLPDRCPFLPRCAKATTTCRTSPKPPLGQVEAGHWAACYNPVQHD